VRHALVVAKDDFPQEFEWINYKSPTHAVTATADSGLGNNTKLSQIGSTIGVINAVMPDQVPLVMISADRKNGAPTEAFA